MTTRAQLRALGLSDDSIEDWIQRDRLHRLHRGVYAVGHRALHRHAAWTAAVLACGPGAVLSHRSAAALWGIRPTSTSRVEVSVSAYHGRRPRSGIHVHRTGTLAADEVTRHERIVVTTVARTLVDLAEVLPRRALERAADEAEVLRRFDLTALRRTIDAHPQRAGCVRMRALLEDHVIGTTLTRSELEDRVVALCDGGGLPRPRVNARVAGLEVDFLWRDHQLIAEADSHRYHGTRRAFERDRQRDALLMLAGYRVVRFTDRRIAAHPDEVAATLAELLLARSPSHARSSRQTA